MKIIITFLCLLISNYTYAACEHSDIRSTIPGYGAGGILHPDYKQTSSSLYYYIGIGETKQCDEVYKTETYYMFPTGYIAKTYKTDKMNLTDLGKAIKEIEQQCNSYSSFSDMLLNLSNYQLSNSQLYIVLHEIRTNNLCTRFDNEINDELKTLFASPLLKREYFNAKIEQFMTMYKCNNAISSYSYARNPNMPKFLRITISNYDRAIAVVMLSSENRIQLIEPLVRLEDLSKFSPDEPCFKLLNHISNLKKSSEDEIQEYAKRIKRLKEFDALPMFTSTFYEPIDKENYVKVSQGQSNIVYGKKGIYTTGMAPCIGVLVVNTSTNAAFLIHADANTNVEFYMENLKERLKGNTLEVYIAGGSPTTVSRDTLFRILKELEKQQIQVKAYRPNPLIDGLGYSPDKGIF